jgi:hypothetical protein
MKKTVWAVLWGLALAGAALADTGDVEISGELRQWHKVTLTLDGPFSKETDTAPNPFTDLQMNVRFTHESGAPDYLVPAYFAADGHAAETAATEGNKWRAHLSPDKAGTWNYTIEFKNTPFDGTQGTFLIEKTDKTGADLRGKGRLQYVGSRYLRHAGSGEWFLKAGADAPETFLGYADFDGTIANNPKKCPLKTWAPHLQDWHEGDPQWQEGKGKGMIGAINYLAEKGCNAFSFLTYNAGGDGDNVWPHVSREDKRHFDCSKLDQWGLVFDHATAKGMYLHFKLQETENDDLNGKNEAGKAQALDNGELGIERKAYLREMIARFGHNLALNWNMGEENTQSFEQLRAQARFIRATDPYGHHVVLHTYPNQQEKYYGEFLGQKDVLTGVSIQNSAVKDTHKDALKWVTRSAASGHPWVISFDESGSAGVGAPPDPDYPGVAEVIAKNQKSEKPYYIPTIDEVRGQTLWGTLMAGGMGVEYYFGYKLPENDLRCEDWRSRDKTWDYSRIALNFFRKQVPFWEMKNSNALIGNKEDSNDGYCLSCPGEVYLIYLPKVEKPTLDLSGAKGSFSVQWFNPRAGGPLQDGSVKTVEGGGNVLLGNPPADPEKDWAVLVRGVAPLFAGKDGLLIMDVESTVSPLGQWLPEKKMQGFTGRGHLEFSGNQPPSGPVDSPLKYHFTVDQDGIYRLMIRAYKRLEGAPPDQCNDCYVRLDGDFESGGEVPLEMLKSDTKLYGGKANAWGWTEKLDKAHKKFPPFYKLKAGSNYTLTISGRSQRFNMDRIVFRHESVSDEVALSPAQPESKSNK